MSEEKPNQEITADNVEVKQELSAEEAVETQEGPTQEEIDAQVDSLLGELEDKEFEGPEYSDEEKEVLGLEKEETKEDLKSKNSKKDQTEESEDGPDSEKSDKSEAKESPAGTLEFKVKGEDRSMSLEEIKEKHPEVLEDLKSGVSSQVRAKELQSALDKDKKEFYNKQKEFETEKQAIEQYIEKTREKLQNGDIESSVKVLAELGGIPFHQYKAQLLQYALPQLVAQQEMTPEQIRIQELEEERAYEKEQQESRNQRAQAEQTRAELVASIKEAREAHKIEDDEWDTALQQTLEENENAEVSDVVEVVQRNRVTNTANEVISELKEFPKESEDALRQIAIQNPDFDKETLIEIAKEAMSKTKDNSKSKAVEKEVGQKLSKKLKPTPKPTEEEKTESEIDSLISKYLLK